MIEPTERDVGRRVIYEFTVASDAPTAREIGVITSFNDQYVFVRYAGKTYSEATPRRLLRWEHEDLQGANA